MTHVVSLGLTGDQEIVRNLTINLGPGDKADLIFFHIRWVISFNGQVIQYYKIDQDRYFSSFEFSFYWTEQSGLFFISKKHFEMQIIVIIMKCFSLIL